MSELEWTKFIRHPFIVDAVQLTEDNIDVVTRETGGKRLENFPDRVYIVQGETELPTMFTIGDWLIKDSAGKYRRANQFIMTKDYHQFEAWLEEWARGA